MARIPLHGFVGGMMFESIKKSWKKIQNDPPGKRFRRQYQRRQKARKSIFNKILFMGIGIIIILVGIVMLPAPGPGTVVIFLGLGFIAQESLCLSMLLDKLEVNLRSLIKWGLKTWKDMPFWAKVVFVFFALIIAGLIAYGSYLLFMA